MSKKDVDAAMKLLKAAGYKVATPPDDLVVKTFKLRRDVSEAFYKRIKRDGLKVQDAIEEALLDWMKK